MAGPVEALLRVVERGGPTMFARIGLTRALNRRVERMVSLRGEVSLPHGGAGRQFI